MRTDRRALEDVARRLTPPGAVLTHLCSTDFSTFQVEIPGGSPYALKVSQSHCPECDRSDAELAALLELDHPHLVPFLDAGSFSDGAMSYRWLTMKLVDGMTLDSYMASARSHDASVTAGLFRDAVAAAAALWSNGTTHRDLSPENMIVTPAAGLVVVDLGMRRSHDNHVAQLPVSQPLWIAPEQVEGRSPSGDDWRSDQYVLGLLGLSLLTGVVPFSPASADRTHAAAEGPTVRALDAATPLAGILSKMLAVDPVDRWADADVLLSAIETEAASIAPGRTLATNRIFQERREEARCALVSSGTA